MDYRQYKVELLEAIEHRANCKAGYLHTQPVRIVEENKVVWQGKIEVYQLVGHPQAQKAFGWGIPGAQKKMEYITVVGIPPLDNPVSAVKAFLASRR